MLDESGKIWRLSDLRGQKMILFFYPIDDTPGCTIEACDFRDSYGGTARRRLSRPRRASSGTRIQAGAFFHREVRPAVPWLLIDEGADVR